MAISTKINSEIVACFRTSLGIQRAFATVVSRYPFSLSTTAIDQLSAHPISTSKEAASSAIRRICLSIACVIFLDIRNSSDYDCLQFGFF